MLGLVAVSSRRRACRLRPPRAPEVSGCVLRPAGRARRIHRYVFLRVRVSFRPHAPHIHLAPQALRSARGPRHGARRHGSGEHVRQVPPATRAGCSTVCVCGTASPGMRSWLGTRGTGSPEQPWRWSSGCRRRTV